MFSPLKRLFGLFSIQERGDLIHIEGLPAHRVTKDIRDIWSTSRIANHMFTSVDGSSVSFNKFFALDFVYTLQKVCAERQGVRAYRMLEKIVEAMYEHTWLRTTREKHPDIIDFKRIKSTLNIELLEKQVEFLVQYNENVPKFGLRGYVLGAPPGSGKTIACLALAAGVAADVTVEIVPKNAVVDVWEDTIKTRYRKTQRLWTSLSGLPLTEGYEHYVFHYEQLARAVEFFKQVVRRKRYKNPCIILDESHNLNEISAQRTLLFVELCLVLDALHVVWSSGTPVKAMGGEMIPFLMTVDRLFDKDAQERFKQIFGVSSSRANDILANRLGLMTYLVDKRAVVKAIPDTKTQKVKIPNGDDYTLATVREEMKTFILARMRYYEQNMHLFVDIYEEGLEVFEKTLKTDAQREEYRLYRDYIYQIRFHYDPVLLKDQVVFCNKYEKNVIMPVLPKDLKDSFKNARSVVKYYFLKVQGEALGGVLGRKRAQCIMDLVEHAQLPMMIDNSASKSLIFSTYVSVVKKTQEYLEKEGYNSLTVFADTNKHLSKIIAQFTTDEKIDPLIATYDSLSTAVPVLAASTVILLNAPFRDYEYTQAVSRVDRLGQQSPVTIWNVYLDTGAKPNISTRSKDILEWSREQVEQILGKKTGDTNIALETYPDSHLFFSANELSEKPSWANWR